MGLLGFLLVGASFMTGCATLGGPVHGKVLDEATDEPIEGAIVVARWTGHLAGWADGKTVCYHAESTVADKSGNYYLPRWWDTNTEAWQRKVKPEDVYITAYKPGYIWSEKRGKGIKYLKVFKGTRAERLEFLKYLGLTCNNAGKSMRNLFPAYKWRYEETRKIAITREDKKLVKLFRRNAARAAVAEDGDSNMTSKDMDILIDAYLKEHFQE